jgi:hypothetical protein
MFFILRVFSYDGLWPTLALVTTPRTRVMNVKTTSGESETDVAIKAAMDAVLGNSYFAKPKQVCTLLNISLSTYNRAIRAGTIKTTPHGDYPGVSRPALHPLMKYGFGSMSKKSVA